MTTSYLNGALPLRVETMLEKIYKKQNHPPIKMETRRRLSSISEELALQTLYKVHNADYVKGTLNGFIRYLLDKAVTVNSSPRVSSGESPAAQSLSPSGRKSCRAFQGPLTVSLL